MFFLEISIAMLYLKIFKGPLRVFCLLKFGMGFIGSLVLKARP